MRRVNRVVTNPILGMIARVVPPLAVVHHIGRTAICSPDPERSTRALVAMDSDSASV
jgi:hypothetical protein